MTQTPETIDIHAERAPRTSHTERLYAAVIGENLKGAHRIADIGAGDSDFALNAPEDVAVLRVDAQYASKPPEGGDYLAARAQDLSSIPDGSVDASVSVLMMQHIPHGKGDVAQAVSEMVRVTKHHQPGEEGIGNILIYPVWRSKKLQKELADKFSDVAAIGYPDPDGLDKLSEEYLMPTLMIVHTKALDGDRLSELAHVIEKSEALKKRTTVRDVARRALIARTGNSTRDTSKKRDNSFSLY